MTETVDSEMLKAVFELTHIQRWEDDGGAVFETDNPLPQATNTPQPMDLAGECLLFKKYKHA